MRSGSLRLAVEVEPDLADLAQLEEYLATAAVEAVGQGAEQDFGVFVRDGDRVVGGASGTIWGGGCQVHTLWVDPSLRACGLARKLMRAVETHAREHGCRLVMGLTYDVLTGDFYDRLGYETVGFIEGCPAGTTTRWYRKDL
jgi:GNAT superfamily N-acetyltransferase